ncbi:phage tail tip lysozyme [Lactococcus petauri]|uniref:phage tail tip lysozyme n=1 Tax=Lactococcus petauri TaxID=1940789 RepID=UPI0018A90149|nr:phage tail tip lysozyme [Lactococcus petauri]MDC0808930.1 phage tail tip lysozyme [Lactococcus petauri]MDC0812784.1 phage tail tip lysozyme [Lactococcus petauri]
MKKIYLYDKMPGNLAENGLPILDWRDLPEITRSCNNTFSFYGNYHLRGEHVKQIKRKKYIKAFTENGTYQYFRIKSVKKNLSGVAITATHLGYEANRNFIKSLYVPNGNGKQIMAKLKESLAFSQPFKYESDVTSNHQFTVNQANPIEAIIGSNNGNENLSSICDAELDMDNYTLNLKKRIGEDKGFRIDFGKNLAVIEETIDDSSVVNRLFLVGGVPDDTDYNKPQNPVTFSYLSVSGVAEEDVQIARRENSECKTVADLKKWGQSLFDKDRIHEPKVTHEVDMVSLENTLEYQELYREVSGLRFGDTVHVSLKNLEIEVQERMIEYVWYPTICKYKSIVLGNDLEMYTSSIETQVTSVKQKLETRSEELISAVNNATQWITGNKGGYVLLDPKDAPERILIMDKPNAKDAKKVWQWNVNGLGYSSTGINGQYGLAMTRDGHIVADFIKAGTLEGIKIRSVDDKFIVEMYNGKVRFIRNLGNGKEEEMVAFTPSLNNETGELNGIGLVQNPGYKFAISSKNSDGTFSNVVRVPADSTGSKPKLELFGDVSVSGRLLLNGQEVVAGGGSGGGEGEFPPEIVTDQEKNAWIVWQFLKSKGYTEQAAAGILGNMDQESGVMPDTDQVGGPAYGLVQWDGSAYPLVPPATWNGREYVQNLMRAAGISGDYKIAKTQSQLLEWCMFNGQYIKTSAYPYSVAQFKGLTNISTATTAFEANFERPAVTHPERVQLAIKWYNKLHGLKPPTPSGNLKEQLDKFYNTYKERYVQNGQCVGLTTAWMATLTANKYGMTPWNSQAYNPDGSPTSGNPRWNYEINIGDGISAATIGTFAPPPGWTKIIPHSAEDCKAGDIFYVGTDSGISTGHTGIVFEDGKNGRVPTLDQNFLNSPVRWFDGGPSSSWGLYNWFCIWRKNT